MGTLEVIVGSMILSHFLLHALFVPDLDGLLGIVEATIPQFMSYLLWAYAMGHSAQYRRGDDTCTFFFALQFPSMLQRYCRLDDTRVLDSHRADHTLL